MRFISFWRFWNVVVISLSSQQSAARDLVPAVQPIHGKGKLPARFARLPRGLTVIFGRETVASAAALAASAAATGATKILRAAKGLGAAWRAALALRARFIYFQVAPAHFLAIE